LTIIEKIEKETSLDEHLQEAKNELQIIHNKLAPYRSQIYPIILKEGTTKEKLEGLDKYQLENCKKALEKMEKIIYLNEVDKHLLEIINDELKALNLQTEIEELKKNKTDDSQQQVENQKKIEQKERELEKIKKKTESRENKHFQVSPQILSKFFSFPNFNTKEKIETLINPVKDNPEFLQEIQIKYQIEDLNILFTDKSPEEIITVIKRFEYDNLSARDKENKIKKIKAYYQQLNQLEKNGNLTEKQVNDYLLLEATEKLESRGNLIVNQDKQKTYNTAKFILPLLLLLLGASLGLLIKRRTQNKNYLNHYVWQAKDTKNYNIRVSFFKNKIMKNLSNLITIDNEKNISDGYESEENELDYDSKNFEAFY